MVVLSFSDESCFVMSLVVDEVGLELLDQALNGNLDCLVILVVVFVVADFGGVVVVTDFVVVLVVDLVAWVVVG